MRIRPLVVLSMLAAATSCGSDGGGAPIAKSVASVRINGASSSLLPGQVLQLSAVALDATGAQIGSPGAFAWSSSATSVATVDQTGKVTSTGAGTTAIGAQVAGVTGILNLTVTAPPASKDTIFTLGMAAFSPTFITVKVGAVVWFSLGFDGVGHDVLFASQPGSPAYIPVSVRKNVAVTFPIAGSFSFSCPTHPQMTGTVTVQ